MADLADVSDQTFEEEILNSDKPALVDFWAEWCAPCRQISPIISDIADSYGARVKIVKMNIDENPNTPGKYGVRAIPTVLAFHGGEVVDQLTGARPKRDFEAMVKKLVG